MPDAPLFSVCIPQYNRTSFVLEACRSLAGQTFRDFELCISDDCSSDGRERELLSFLEASGMAFVYRRQAENGRYDRNLRAAIALARGRYCVLLGNDDRLADPETLEHLRGGLSSAGQVGVAVGNYEDCATARLFVRAPRSGVIGSGPSVAVRQYRNFSFLSGIVLDTARAQAHATDRWDGSEMYQVFVACRIIAEGLPLLGVTRVTVRKGIQLPGERVDSYARPVSGEDRQIRERRLPLVDLGRVVVDAVAPYVPLEERSHLAEGVLLQLLCFPYPYWVVEYRRVRSWKYAVGVCLGMRVKNIGEGFRFTRWRRLRLGAAYWLSTVVGLLVPVALFRGLYPLLYALAKSPYSAAIMSRARR